MLSMASAQGIFVDPSKGILDLDPNVSAMTATTTVIITTASSTTTTSVVPTTTDIAPKIATAITTTLSESSTTTTFFSTTSTPAPSPSETSKSEPAATASPIVTSTSIESFDLDDNFAGSPDSEADPVSPDTMPQDILDSSNGFVDPIIDVPDSTNAGIANTSPLLPPKPKCVPRPRKCVKNSYA